MVFIKYWLALLSIIINVGMVMIIGSAAVSIDDLLADGNTAMQLQRERAEQQQQFQWVDLSEEQLSQWFTPTDLCALENENKYKFPQDFRKDNCSQYSRGSRRMHCGVGMGANSYPCYPPFGAARPSFKRGIKGFTDASSKPLLTALEQFMRTNTTLVLLGDSTMRQKLQALECQVLREDSRIRTNGNLWGILPCESKLILYFPDGRQYTVLAISVGPNSVKCLKGTSGDSAAYLQRQEQQLSEEIRIGKGDPVADMKARKAFENAQFLIDQLNREQQRSVFVVANMGLWYNQEGLYLRVMPLMMEWLASVAAVGADESSSSSSFSSPIGTSSSSNSIDSDTQASSETSTKIEREGDLIKTITTTVTTTITKLDTKGAAAVAANRGTEITAIAPVATPAVTDAQATKREVLKSAGGVPLHNKVAWHETLLQHWVNSDHTGYFLKSTVDTQETLWRDVHQLPTAQYMVPHCCQAASNVSFLADWRNDIANALIRRNVRWQRLIRVLPMAEITRPLSDLHTCAPLFRHDCTHYCFTPLLYQPLWHQIAQYATATTATALTG